MPEPWIESLVRRIDLVERLRVQLGSNPWDDGWRRSRISGIVATDTLDATTLQDIAESGCRVELEIAVERLRVRAIAEDSRLFAIDAFGEWADVAQDDAAAAAAASAAARNDVASLLASLPGIATTVDVTVTEAELDRVWVRTSTAFVAEYERIGWFGFSQLLKSDAGMHRSVLVVAAGDSVVNSPGIVICGPIASGVDLSQVRQTDARWQPGDQRAVSPAPSDVLPMTTNGTELDDAKVVLLKVAGSLAWLWIADAVSVIDATVKIRLAGAKLIEGDLGPCPPHFAASSVALWRWTDEQSQPARRYAAIQATTLQVEKLSDLYSRAGSILETAKFLFGLSQAGLVQEVVAARRSARDAAVNAGRSAADRAQAAARSAVDRVLVIVGAAVGIVFANEGGLIDLHVAWALLGLAAALTIGAGLLAFHVDLPGARHTVTVFKKELGHYTEVLSPNDITSISALPSLAEGETEVDRARTATFAIIGAAIAAVVVSSILVGPSPAKRSQHPPAVVIKCAGTSDHHRARSRPLSILFSCRYTPSLDN